MHRFMSALAILWLLASPAASQDFDAGMQAYLEGDYAAALHEWRPLAEQGDAEAQFNLGIMFYEG